MRWIPIRASSAEEVKVSITITGSQGLSDRRALLAFDFDCYHDDAVKLNKLTVSPNPEIGLYSYVATGPTQQTTCLKIKLPPGCSRFRLGLRSWQAECDVEIESIKCEIISENQKRATATSGPPISLLSVDVEALVGRAHSNHVEKLIYGKFGDGGEYGIRRLCDILDEYSIRATFFLDYAGCIAHGDAGLFRAAEFIESRGHDVQLHAHSETFARSIGIPLDPNIFPSFEFLEKDLARRCLEYSYEQYHKSMGRAPKIFRPGGMRHSLQMYEVVKEMNFEAVSAVFRPRSKNIEKFIRNDSVFSWDNGLKEIVLDYGLDPLIDNSRDAASGKVPRRQSSFINSYLIHSTSLLKRDFSGANPYFEGYHAPYEKVLRSYLEQLCRISVFKTHADILTQSEIDQKLQISDLYR